MRHLNAHGTSTPRQQTLIWRSRLPFSSQLNKIHDRTFTRSSNDGDQLTHQQKALLYLP